MPSRNLRRGLLAVSLWLLFISTPTLAQPQMAATYRQAAQKYREAASQSKSPHNRSCYQAHAQYYDCLAAQLGPNGPRECHSPTCQPQAETTGGGTSGATPTGDATAGSTTPANDAGTLAEQMNEMRRRRETERAVEEAEREEFERHANLKPRDMTPAGAKDLSNLLDGKDAAEGLKAGDTKNRESLYGSGDGGRAGDASSQMSSLADELAAGAENDRNYAASDETGAKARLGTEAAGPGGADFYRAGDPANSSLYTPFARAEERGWGETTSWTPPAGADGVPSSITFEKDGVTVATYSNRAAIPKSITFNPDGTGVVEYGPDAAHAQGTTLYTRHGRVVDVRGPVDDRVPTTVTYGRDGAVLKAIHGTSANNAPRVGDSGVKPATPNQAALNQSPFNQPPFNQPSKETAANLRGSPSPAATFIPPKAAKELPEPTPDSPGLLDKVGNWVKEKREQGRQWWNENITQPVSRVRQCATDPLTCIGLDEVTKP